MSVVHVFRGTWAKSRFLDGKPVQTITAFLSDRGHHADPARLASNRGLSFQGGALLGMGFTFDDHDKKGIATPLAEMHRLLRDDPHNGLAISPYVGGAEINGSPTHAHDRYVVNFRNYPRSRVDRGQVWEESNYKQRQEWLRTGVVPADYPEPVAEDWPELLRIVENSVKPERLRSAATSNSAHAQRCRVWWQHYHLRKELYRAVGKVDRVVAISRHTQNPGFVYLSSEVVYAESLVVFSLPTYAAFCALQSRTHEIWARFFGSSMKDDLRYTPSDCFETFPFPTDWEEHPGLEAPGKTYDDYRAALMIENDEGLTKTYNRFHDPYETSATILKLRELHAAMDRAVLSAYGWTDIPTDCEFLLDYEIDEEAWGNKKKPYRYRWPNEVRHDGGIARKLSHPTLGK